MLFSVIIPVYNVEKYLKECLQSILSQLESMDNDCEILLIDDGSTDESGRICDEYVDKYPATIKVFHKQNEGLLLTRRYGFGKALGEYVINCDSDDLLEPDMLKSVRDVVRKYDSPDVIIINHNMYDDGNRIVAYENIFTKERDCRVNKQDLLREFMLGHSVVSVCGKIVKRSCINTNIDYSSFGKLSTGEDTLQSIEFFSNSKMYVYLNEALYDYRCGSGMTTKFDADYYFTFKRIFEEIKKQESEWNLENFDELFAVKVLQTTGRAITQSRYKKWKSVKDHRKYLENICNDDMFQNSYDYICKLKNGLQKNHFMLLLLLKHKLFCLMIFLLNAKNLI